MDNAFHSFDLLPRCFNLHLDEICLTSFRCSDSKRTSTVLFSNAPMNARTSFVSNSTTVNTPWWRQRDGDTSPYAWCVHQPFFANVYSPIVFSSKHLSHSQITVMLLCTWSNIMLKIFREIFVNGVLKCEDNHIMAQQSKDRAVCVLC